MIHCTISTGFALHFAPGTYIKCMKNKLVTLWAYRGRYVIPNINRVAVCKYISDELFNVYIVTEPDVAHYINCVKK